MLLIFINKCNHDGMSVVCDENFTILTKLLVLQIS
jgi:hypothetical protein